MDIRLIGKLIISFFSFRRHNMRFFNFKRILIAIFFLPIFVLLLLINRFFLLLDYLIFFGFRKTKIEKSIFIISVPRCATTYLFHKLASNKSEVTSFKLWELLFAPSIIQKYVILLFLKFDRLLGRPIVQLIQYFEPMLFKKFKEIHKGSLSMPEEDEFIQLWNLSSVFFNFFYPDTDYFEDYFSFDERLNPKIKTKVMQYYYRCVQRHNYVFNRSGNKYFLSKNPAMMPKIESLHHLFPTAIIYNINRCPSKSFPSTIALNNAVYDIFTSIKPSEHIDKRTKTILKNWLKMAEENLIKYFPNQTVRIDFNLLVNKDPITINEICEKVNFSCDVFAMTNENTKFEKRHIAKNPYENLKKNELEEILSELPFLRKYCT